MSNSDRNDHGIAGAMLPADSPEYLAALAEHLATIRHTDFYDGCWRHFTDLDRFDGYIDAVEPFHSLAGATIFDSGAGSGGLLLAAARRGMVHGTGTEVVPSIHNLAQVRLAGTGIEVLLVDDERVPLADASFDVIFSIHVIEHVVSPSLYLSELERLLRPGGALLLACPNRFWPVEQHGRLPFLTLLPVSWSKRYCLRRWETPTVPAPIRQQYLTATLLNHFISFLTLRRWCRQAGLEFVMVNPPQRFTVLPEDFGAWGEAHTLVRGAFTRVADRLVGQRIAPWVRGHAASRAAHWTALMLNHELLGVLRHAT